MAICSARPTSNEVKPLPRHRPVEAVSDQLAGDDRPENQQAHRRQHGDNVIDQRDMTLLEANDVVQRAHQPGPGGASVHLPQRSQAAGGQFPGNPAEEYRLFFELGVDGVFSDFTDTAVAARTLMQMR